MFKLFNSKQNTIISSRSGQFDAQIYLISSVLIHRTLNIVSGAHRRHLAEQRKRREAGRLSFLKTAMDQADEAALIREFLRLHDGRPVVEPELKRMLDWAASRLDRIALALSPAGVAEHLNRTALFPDPDPLDDPQGEPPTSTGWMG
jgi:hypothetical protein